MESFRRYAKAYLTNLDHPFSSDLPRELSLAELDEALNFTCQILATTVNETRLSVLLPGSKTPS